MNRNLATSLTLVALLAMFAITALAQTPASELRAAVADVERLPADVRPGVRYLSLYAIPPERRAEATRVVSYTLNSLSRTRAIFQPTEITPTLLRFSISNFVADGNEFAAWSAAWEKLVEADPYWHLPTEIAASSGPNNPTHQAPTPAQAAQADRIAVERVTVDGGWVGLEDAAKLRALTASTGAILRADDFVARADDFARLLRLRRHSADRARVSQIAGRRCRHDRPAAGQCRRELDHFRRDAKAAARDLVARSARRRV